MPGDTRSSGCGSTGDGRRGRRANLRCISEKKKAQGKRHALWGNGATRVRQSPIARLAPSGLSFSKKSVKSPTKAIIATTSDPARPMKNMDSRINTRKCSIKLDFLLQVQNKPQAH